MTFDIKGSMLNRNVNIQTEDQKFWKKGVYNYKRVLKDMNYLEINKDMNNQMRALQEHATELRELIISSEDN